jgi:hypothetical protein
MTGMRTLPHPHGPTDSKRFASFSVALCLALAGAGVALVALRSHRDEASDAQLVTDSSEQRQLREGWRELGTLAASYPPVVPSSAPSPAAPAPQAPAEPPPGAPAEPPPEVSSLSSTATPAAAAGGSLAGNGGNAGNGAGGSGGNAAPPQPIDNTQSTLPVAHPASQACGLTTCNIDSVCCNPSCGICAAPGDDCSQRECG